jgi:hypothetical protein
VLLPSKRYFFEPVKYHSSATRACSCLSRRRRLSARSCLPAHSRALLTAMLHLHPSMQPSPGVLPGLRCCRAPRCCTQVCSLRQGCRRDTGHPESRARRREGCRATDCVAAAALPGSRPGLGSAQPRSRTAREGGRRRPAEAGASRREAFRDGHADSLPQEPPASGPCQPSLTVPVTDQV